MTPFRLAIATVIATFALLFAGGLVNPTGSSLACPDWPLCYGSAFPEMTGGVQYEHSHRLAAAAVALASVWLAIVTWRTPGTSPRARRLTLGLVGLVAAQAALGGITVIYRLPTLVSTAHLALSQAFFLLAILAVFWLRTDVPPSRPLARTAAGVALAATFVQVVLGGLVRHVGAGRACGVEVPFCGGSPWPGFPMGRLHMLHRYSGVAVAIIALVAGAILVRRAHAAGRTLSKAAALAAMILVVLQVGLGVLTVTSGVGLAQVMAHFVVAVLLVAAWQACLLGLGPSGAGRRSA